MPEDDQRAGARATERLTYFSDAVVAIAITLLAIELPVPEGDTVRAFWSSVRDNSGHYVAFLISFTVIAAAWNNHHDLFGYAERVDARLRTLNMCWLLTIVLNPFATRMLTVSGHQTIGAHALRFGFYALLQLLESATLFAMLQHMVAHEQLAGAPRRLLHDTAWQSYVLMLGFGLSIPVFFVTTYAWALWFLIPLFVVQLRRLRHRSHPDPGAS